MKRHKIKGSIAGIKMDSNLWYVRLDTDCPLGKAGEIILASKAEKSTGGELEIEQ